MNDDGDRPTDPMNGAPLMEESALDDLSKPYEPKAVEERWYKFWEENHVFEANDDSPKNQPVYVIPMPPPNVTGSLHMGHAQRCTLEDSLTRWHRMRGYNTLWQPGIDHAGIATQLVVERQLQREGKTRLDLGREEFEKRIWKWKAESGGRIAEQQRVLGASPDWRRSKFTMDPDMNRAVREAFVKLHEDGLMYRATRLINWCPECMTALSDLEVENEEGANGELFEFAYKVEGTSEEIVVATTRPETMLGDTAVAVHSGDPRYTHLHGKRLEHPFSPRTIPIITDDILVDPKFGTGAVKVTPAHDFNDFATGKRHHLEEISIFNLDGTVNEHGGKFQGLDRKRARTAVKKALDEIGLARGSKPHTLTLPRCQRSGGVVEPMISTQWFLKMEAMAKAAVDAIDRNEDESAKPAAHKTKIIPYEWTKTYDHFLSNIQDWCVSRQLWWGHQIPAWHGPNGEIVVARERPSHCTEEAGWKQDPDVLDTWFSSALWPFATLGWPEKTKALETFYPTNPLQESDLETGYDILFFWVARMMMFGLYFTGEVPFRRVLLSGLITDETGDKMSKVKGNVIDPLDLIYGADFKEMVAKVSQGAPEAEALAKFKKAYPSAAQMGAGFPAFGADALRFTLATFPPSNKRIALALKRLEGYRHFLNKIWNATRFSLENIGPLPEIPLKLEPKFLFNRWILGRLDEAATIASKGIGSFRIDEAALEMYRFFWNDFCDWYVEITKTIFAPGSPYAEHVEETKLTTAIVLEASLRLMHPLMPYVTEELWQRVPKPKDHAVSVALAPYPTANGYFSAEIDAQVELIKKVVSAARTVRSEHGVKPSARVQVAIRTSDATTRERLQAAAFAIQQLARTNEGIDIAASGPRIGGSVLSSVPSASGSIDVIVVLKGLITAEEERSRIERETKRLDKDIQSIEKKLSSKGFAERAPKEVIDEAHLQLKTMKDAKARLEEARALADELDAEEKKS
jgi:valyl-tRNA synthetase